MRAFATSWVKAIMLVQRWVTPGAVGLVIAISGISSVPSTVLTTPATLPLTMQWAHGYSGCVGVSAIACQVVSRSVAGFSSISPLRIAVTGLVSRASPVQTAVGNCTRDEGGPFEVGNHGPISSRCKLLRSKAVVGSVAVKLGPKVQDGKVERGERKRTAAEVSKSD